MADDPRGDTVHAYRESKPDGARVWALVSPPTAERHAFSRRHLCAEAELNGVTFIERDHPTVTALAEGVVKAMVAGPRGDALTVEPPHFYVDGARVTRCNVLRLHGDGSATVEGAA